MKSLLFIYVFLEMRLDDSVTHRAFVHSFVANSDGAAKADQTSALLNDNK
jgi:hypothetical protein